MPQTSRRVVITGMGIVSPVGTTVDKFWENIRLGKSGTGLITRFDASGMPSKIAAEVKDWTPEETFSPREIRRKDLLSLYALKAATEAWTSAINDDQVLNKKRCGVIWASGNGGIDSLERGLESFIAENGRFSPFYIPRILLDTPAGEIALQYGLQGINFATVSACASSNNAIMDAVNYIRWNKADLIIAGGSEAPITKSLVGGFGAMKALSKNTESPERASRPFDTDRDGFVMGEGAGALVLESLEHAQSRGAEIIAEIAGAACNNDAFHPTATHPEGTGAAAAIELALEDAELSPADVDHVNLHATSTKVGDLSEINALQRVFSNRKELLITATKSVTGHLLGAAGALEAIVTANTIRHNLVPPTMHVENLDPAFPAESYQLVRDEAIPTEVNVAISNNFGFGGHNTIVVFKKFKG